jgi:signal transduction histidine kinase/DNA-binding NarL/FixJ family response regulator
MKNHKKKNLRDIAIYAMVILFFLGIIIVYYLMLYSQTRESLIKSGEINALSSVETINSYLATGSDALMLSGYTLDNMLRENKTNEEMHDYIRNQTPAVADLTAHSSTGIYGYINDEYMDGLDWVPDADYVPTERPWYIAAMSDPGKVVIVDPYLDAETHTIMITLAKSLCDGKSVVAMDLAMDQLQAITEVLADRTDSYIEMILDDECNVIAHSEKQEIGKNYKQVGGSLGNRIVSEYFNADERAFSIKDHGKEYIVYAISLENNWVFMSVSDTTSVYMRLQIPLILSIVAAILILAVLVPLLISSNRKTVLAEKLSLQTERAIAASDAKSAFLSSMSHEIRTPINAVLGMNEMILRECEDESILSYSQNIKTAGNTLLGLINDILDFSKIEAGKIEILPVDYDLSSVITDLVNMIKTRADAKDLALNLDIDKEIPRMLHGDEVRIKQVITNILTNAVKYTEKGNITFRVGYDRIERDTESIMVNVSVTDTGIGIKKDDLKKLFSQFERIEETRNRNIEGTGLGMSITKRLLEMMGSDLHVASDYGKGSTFYFSLKQKVVKWEPLGDYETSYHTLMNERIRYRESFTARDANVLIVDDAPMNLLVFKNLLKQTLVKIDTASSGDEGIALCTKNKYDIIFLDHMMPKKDGIQTLHELKELNDNLNTDTPVICLTANAISGAREKYIAEGFSDYLTKPIDASELETMMQKYLPHDKIGAPVETASRAEVLESDDRTDDIALSALEPLRDSEIIDVKLGIKNCRTPEAYISILKVFYESIEETATDIDNYYKENDLLNYTIRIHSLKSSSKTIGASSFSQLAKELEDAGNRFDISYISDHHDLFIEAYKCFTEPLSEIFCEGAEEESDKPEADSSLMKETYDELMSAAEEMNSDRLEAVLDKMSGYRIPDSDAALWDRIRCLSERFDHEEIVALLKEKSEL